MVVFCSLLAASTGFSMEYDTVIVHDPNYDTFAQEPVASRAAIIDIKDYSESLGLQQKVPSQVAPIFSESELNSLKSLHQIASSFIQDPSMHGPTFYSQSSFVTKDHKTVSMVRERLAINDKALRLFKHFVPEDFEAVVERYVRDSCSKYGFLEDGDVNFEGVSYRIFNNDTTKEGTRSRGEATCRSGQQFEVAVGLMDGAGPKLVNVKPNIDLDDQPAVLLKWSFKFGPNANRKSEDTTGLASLWGGDRRNNTTYSNNSLNLLESLTRKGLVPDKYYRDSANPSPFLN